MIEALIACPSCGERMAIVHPATAGKLKVTCACGWSAPAQDTALAAIDKWNQRVGLKPFFDEVIKLTKENETLRVQLLRALNRLEATPQKATV